MIVLNFKDVGLTYQFEHECLFNSLNIAIEEGKKYGILVEAYSGKTSLAKLMLGLLKPSKGEIIFSDIFATHKVGVLFSDFALMEKKTVYYNIAYPLKVRNINKTELDIKVNKIINEFNLQAYKDTKISKLSAIDKFLVSLARLKTREVGLLIVDDCLACFNDDDKQTAKILLDKFTNDIKTIVYVSDTCEVMADATEFIAIADKNIIKLLDLDRAKVYTNTEKWNMAKKVILEINDETK